MGCKEKKIKKQKNKLIHTINMVVKDDADFLSVFSTRETPVIASDVADFLEANIPITAIKHQLVLQIKSDCIDENEQKIYKKAIKEYYRERYVKNKSALKKQYIISAVLAILGSLFLGITASAEKIKFVHEFLEIIAWVLVWECVDGFAFRTQELRLEKKKYLAFLNMHMKYID